MRRSPEPTTAACAVGRLSPGGSMHHLAPRAAATMLVLVVSIAVVGQRGRPSAAQLSLGVRAETTQKPKSQPSTGLPAAGPALAVHDYVIIKRDSSESGAPRIIVVKTRTKAEEILVALGKGRSFSTQAIVYSSHPSAKEGGVLDGESLLALPSEVRAAYERLKPGECSDAVKSLPFLTSFLGYRPMSSFSTAKKCRL